MYVSVICRFIFNQISLHKIGLMCYCFTGMIPCMFVTFNRFCVKYFENTKRFNPVKGTFQMKMMHATQKLALLGKNDFE